MLPPRIRYLPTCVKNELILLNTNESVNVFQMNEFMAGSWLCVKVLIIKGKGERGLARRGEF